MLRPQLATVEVTVYRRETIVILLNLGVFKLYLLKKSISKVNQKSVI